VAFGIPIAANEARLSRLELLDLESVCQKADGAFRQDLHEPSNSSAV
jgi:hypothetical protein